ncbi:AlpA family phage regulatory protein [Ralstonia sp. GX3-BWBA]|uniref:helix-turn-helix transcriptional regulator n=1 Tax=Ralstonia sp. GX3-BWBA TaxID=2219865 RepID=UPI000DD3F33B|nr:AlpA family phage regulatory protein [Ralstonia sp. GX3-BWBA]
MDDKILRLPAVLSITGTGKTTLYEWMKLDLFPRQIRLGSRAVGWRASEVAAWLASRTPPNVEQP